MNKLTTHLVLQLDVGVAVAEARDVRHLVLVEMVVDRFGA